MALNVSFPADYGYEIAALFGVPPYVLIAAKKIGVNITPDPEHPTTFKISGSDGLSKEINIKGTAMTLAKANKIGPASKEAIAGQFLAGLNSAIKASNIKDQINMNILGEDLSDHDMDALMKVCSDMYNPEKAIKEQLKTASQQFQEATKKKGESGGTIKWTVKPLIGVEVNMGDSSDANVEKVELATSTYCGQPVKGTSKGSTYYTAARLVGLNVAVRAKYSKLSIRVAGPSLDAYAERLQSLGFTMGSGYASAHFTTPDNLLVSRTFGAVLGGLGMQSVLEVLNVATLIGK